MSDVSVRTSIRKIQTPVGMARAHLWRPPRPCGALVLGHGAGGSSWSADLLALTSLTAHGSQFQYSALIDTHVRATTYQEVDAANGQVRLVAAVQEMSLKA